MCRDDSPRPGSSGWRWHRAVSRTPSDTSILPQAVVSAAKSVAVLPFANMSADVENEYFTDGMAEEIINALSKIQALRVASRTSSFAFKGKNEDIGEIGRKLKVSTVLEGSVRKMGNRLRITAQLVNVADGYHLWSERYDREMEDVFAIQDDISQAIVKALRVILSEGEKQQIEKARAVNVEAYDFYLRGKQYFHQHRRKSLDYARQMFNKAIEIDPGLRPRPRGRRVLPLAAVHLLRRARAQPAPGRHRQQQGAATRARPGGGARGARTGRSR